MKVEEIVYYCLDAIKAFSDDSYITEQHIMFLIDKYRVKLLSQYYKGNTQVSDSNYQIINLTLDKFKDIAYPHICKLVSKEKAPTIMQLGIPSVLLFNGMESENIEFINFKRLKTIGWNKWKNSFAYAALGPMNNLYIASTNPQMWYLTSVQLRGVFENWQQAYVMQNDVEEDEMLREFPLEDTLVPDLIALVVKDVLGVAWRPGDKTNDGDDSLSDIATFVRQNMKKKYNNIVEGEDE